MSETNNKLEIKNLSKRFGEKILFENLSLTVDDPAVLWAPSGWGKTTETKHSSVGILGLKKMPVRLVSPPPQKRP